MLNIEGALKQDRPLRALTGLNRKAFDALLPTFTTMHLNIQQTKPRQRALSGGRKARLLTAQDKLFFILFYFKCYPSFDVARLLFDMHRSQAHEWMHRLQPINIRSGFGTEDGARCRNAISKTLKHFCHALQECNE